MLIKSCDLDVLLLGFNAAAKTLQKEANLSSTRQSESSKDAVFLSPVPSKKLKVCCCFIDSIKISL